MRNLIDISETIDDSALISDLPDAAIRQNCCRAFNELADLQRGKPEAMGGGEMRNPNLFPNGTGLYTHTTEHIGDLTNRMAASWATGREGEGTFGYQFVHEKVSRAVEHARNPYGFERDIRNQARSNYDYYLREGRIEDYGFSHWWAELEEAGLRFASAHAQLPVYNDAQYTARQAAIEIGQMNFDRYETCLDRLFSHLKTVEAWVDYASRVAVDKSGLPIHFNGRA